MIIDIFTSFDTQIYGGMFNQMTLWVIPMIVAFTLISTTWLRETTRNTLTTSVMRIMYKQVRETLIKRLARTQAALSVLFYILIRINLWGIIPYSFSLTTHLMFTAAIALPLWIGLILSSVFNNPYKFTAALLPRGAPYWLNPFLVYIETVRTIVRPLTLAFRLAANIRAGHIVLTLIRIYLSSAIFIPLYIRFTLAAVNVGYIIFELGICIIQAFIFSLLLTLYSNDHQYRGAISIVISTH